MVDSKPEKQFPLPPEQVPPRPEVSHAAEPDRREPTEVTLRKNQEGEQPADTKQQLSEMLHLKRRPRPVLPIVRDEIATKVEKILEEGVGDAYSRLSPIAQQEFKLKGEMTARKIAETLRATHVKVKKIFQLILEWLKLLPGVNRFFLEQEAKIKADKIIALHKNNHQ